MTYETDHWQYGLGYNAYTRSQAAKVPHRLHSPETKQIIAFAVRV